ncbi:MAG: LacI family transcriptional regulator [Lachnospiraceae bacterium]|nr:LacI family transcriptional regulator [Lachnospiraceae bacterium]MDE6980150.1 LacI family transcriptional regulator [Lachnospiraceae bacterium]
MCYVLRRLSLTCCGQDSPSRHREGSVVKNITISDVAEALGVSKTTVSRAISGKGRIGKETRERVLAYIEENNYKPSVIAKGLAQSKTYNIGVMMPAEYDIVDLPFFQNCLFGIQEVAAMKDYDILLSISHPGDGEQLKRVLSNRKVDGVILMRTFVKDLQAGLLAKTDLPFVTIGTTDVEGAVQVDSDHKNACRELTSVLLKKQLKKIALVGGDKGHVVTQKRFQGYREAFLDCGVPLQENLIFLDMEGPDVLEQQMEEILVQGAEVILCMDDMLCSRVLKKLRTRKIRVPKDVKVASFYHSTILEQNVPSITSLSFDGKELGQMACRRLMEQIEGENPQQVTVLGYRIIMADSTE